MQNDATLEFGILGPLVVEIDGQVRAPSAPRQRSLLGMFLLVPGQPMPVERILEELWGEEVPSGGSKTVGFHISKLRDALEPARQRGEDGTFIRTTPAGYVLDIEPHMIDVHRFESLLEEARAVIGHDPGDAAALSRDALGLWRGPALADFAYEEFAQDEIRRLSELQLRAVETRFEADLALGRHADLIAELNGLVSEHPLREGLRATLMVALYRSGRQADALRVFDDTRRTLGEELGIEPSAVLRDLESRILAQDPDLELPVWATPSPAAPRSEDIPNPYIGLRPFSEAEADDFHGREDLTARVVDRLSEERFVALVGPSGSGKSSIANAGVLPIVRDAHVIARMVPGDRPLEELEIALLRAFPDAPASASGILRSDDGGLRRTIQLLEPDRPILLVVDQFEELWSLATDHARAEFMERLLDALDDDRADIKVLATLRSDFLGEPLSSPLLAGWIDHGMILVSPMATAELDAAITKPAERVGVAVDPGLTATVVADVADNPGALPLLQYALTEAFDQREMDALTQDDYRRVGGLRTALTKRAELVYATLDPGEWETCRQLFLRLVTPGEGTGDTRRRLPVEQLADLQPDVEAVTSAFGGARLLTFDHDAATGEATVEVAHEAMLTEWDQLRTWVTEAREELTARRRLDDLAAEWDRSDRDAELLLTSGRLGRFEEWLPASTISVSSLDREFVLASQNRRDETQRRTRRRRLAVFLALGVAAVSTSALSLFAFGASREATRNLAVLESGELARYIIDVNNDDSELAVLLAQEALVGAYEADASLDEAVIALQLALQGVHAAFPLEADAAVVPAGDRASGVFVVPIADLLMMVADNVDRALSPSECEEHLSRPCPTAPPSTRLPESVLSDPVLVREASFNPLRGTFTTLGFYDPGGPTWQEGLSTVSGALGYFIRGEPEPPWLSSFVADPRTDGSFTRSVERSFRDIDIALLEASTWAVLSRDDFAAVTLEGFGVVGINKVIPERAISSALPPAMVEQSTVDGEMTAAWIQYRPTTTLWYRADVLGQLQLDEPHSWGEVMTLTEEIADAGLTPWCFGLAGDTGSDSVLYLIESQILDAGGVELYDAWTRHAIPMNDPRIVAAHEQVGTLLFDERLHRGKDAISRTGGNVPGPFVDPDPACVLWVAPPEWVQGFANRDSIDVGVVTLGGQSVAGKGGVIVDGVQVVLWVDSPESRAFLQTAMSVNFGTIVAARPGGFDLVANMQVDPDVYPDPNSRRLAADLRDAARSDAIRADFYLLNPSLQDVYRTGLRRWFEGGPDVLKLVLLDIEAEWVRIERR